MAKPKDGPPAAPAQPQEAAQAYKIGDPGAFARNMVQVGIQSQQLLTDFLRRQALTSRNVRGGWLTDLALGGLNYQIEHHLFPSMPRPNLRRSQPLIRTFCEEREVLYCETSLVGSFAQALGYLHAVGRPAAAGATA